jgi:hypothetical protein
MNFKSWLEARMAFDPKPRKFQNAYDKTSVSRNRSIKLDKNGNIVELDSDDYTGIGRVPHFNIKPGSKELDLQHIGPQSVDFHKIVKALRPQYPDIDEWTVHFFGQVGHLTTGNKKWGRTVGYWMKQPAANLSNKMPDYFYHGTSTNQWYSGIKKNGLLPRTMSGSMGSYGAQNISSLSQDNLVYLALHPDAATREASLQAANKHGGNPVILRIDGKSLFPDKLTSDEDSRSDTAADSARLMSVVGYNGRVPPQAIKPFLLGHRMQDKNRLYTQWEKFKDVDVAEHPMTKGLKSGRMPYSNDPEYLALKDAGIIGSEKKPDIYGIDRDQDVVSGNFSDEDVKNAIKNAPWVHNARAIIHDMGESYRGHIYKLKDLSIPEKLPPDLQKVINMLIQSGMMYDPKRSYYELSTWDVWPRAVKLAKLMGKMSFKELTNKINQIYQLSPDAQRH